MGIIKRLFGAREDPGSPPAGPARGTDILIRNVTRAALTLRTVEEISDSYFGGPAPLPRSLPWPCNGERPLTFLACLHLPSIAERGAIEWLPTTGRLLFFYDIKEQPWGFDPNDSAGWAVLHLTHDEPVAKRQQGPVLGRRRHLEIQPLSSPPSWQHPALAHLALSHMEVDALEEYTQELLGDAPAHQVGGYPRPVQGDNMEMECQLAAHGIWCGEPSAFETSPARALASGASDWKLLLQMDTDDALNVMWGDCGTIYFWIRDEDARVGSFHKAWLILQCT